MLTGEMFKRVDFSVTLLLLLVAVYIFLTVTLYDWINPPAWIVYSILGVVVGHVLLTLLLNNDNRTGRIIAWLISSILFVECLATVGIMKKLCLIKPEIDRFLANLPRAIEISLSPIFYVTIFFCFVAGATGAVFWFVCASSSLWPRNKTDHDF